MMELAPDGVGSLLRGYRHVHGLNRNQLADALAEALGEVVDPDNIKRWETERRLPEARYHRALAAVMGLPLKEVTRAVAASKQWRLALKAAQHGPGSDDESSTAVKRRAFITAAAATVGAAALSDLSEAHDGINAALTSSHSSDVEYLNQVFERHTGGYHGREPAAVLATMREDLALLRDVLARPLKTAERTDLVRTTAGITGLVAIIEHDQGNQREASAWFATAVRAAAESGDSRLQAWVLARHAMVGLNYGAPHAAAALAARAQAAAGARPTAAAALAAAVHARALAAVGDQEAARQAIARAQDIAGQLGPAELADTWIGYPEQKHHVHLSQAYTLLADTRAAYAEQDAAMALTRAPSVMTRALIAIDRAACLAADRDHAGAAHLASSTWQQLPAGYREGLIRSRTEALVGRLAARPRSVLTDALAS